MNTASRAPPSVDPDPEQNSKAIMSTERFYITTAIFYPNGVPHIGHAYTAIATDVLARFQRLDGKDVFFLTGTDEHGQKMQQTAEKEGIKPIELADKNTAVFRDMMVAQLLQ
jgi:methionyl-tRNA synthetase